MWASWKPLSCRPWQMCSNKTGFRPWAPHPTPRPSFLIFTSSKIHPWGIQFCGSRQVMAMGVQLPGGDGGSLRRGWGEPSEARSDPPNKANPRGLSPVCYLWVRIRHPTREPERGLHFTGEH